MKTGVIFDIKEFAVFDGPGIRTTVFMKGCPLRCQWCHNPEGLSPKRQLTVSPSRCLHCGRCAAHCPSPDHCVACGRCIPYCPLGLRRLAGEEITSLDLGDRLMKGKSFFDESGGGVTFSGGEPLMQWDFVEEVISRLDGVHTAIETSGFAPDEVFTRAMARLSLIMMDIKLTDPEMHRRYTGVDNAPILRHAQMLREGKTPYIIRMPLIPGVNDFPGHFEAVTELVRDAKALVRVELLPYHKTAGAKYPLVGMEYRPDFDTDAPVRIYSEYFTRAKIDFKTL